MGKILATLLGFLVIGSLVRNGLADTLIYIIVIFLAFQILKAIFLSTWKWLTKPSSSSSSISNTKNISNLKKNEFSLALFDRNKKSVYPINNPFEHILCVGGSGTGKTFSVLEPLLSVAALKGYGGFVYDYKTPTLDIFIDRLNFPETIKKLSFNVVDGRYSDRFNIMSDINTSLEAQTLAKKILDFKDEDNFFSTSCVAYFSAILFYFKDRNFPEIVAYIMNENITEVVEKVSEDKTTMMLLRPVLDSLESPKQLSGITATLSSKLVPFIDENIFWTLSGEESLEVNNPENQKMIVMANSTKIEKALGPLLSAITEMVTTSLNRQDKAKSVFVIDELSTLKINDLDRFMSTVRSNKVCCIILFQDIAQLATTYDKSRGEAITANCAYKLFGKNTNAETIQGIQKIFGEYEHTQINKGESGQILKEKTRSKNESILKRQFFSNEEILNLEKGEFISLFPEILMDNKKFGIIKLDGARNVLKEEKERIVKATKEEITINYQRILDNTNQM